MKNFDISKLLLVFALVWLSSCESIKSTVGGVLNLDTDVSMQFLVDADINPDETGLPSPLFVRMYELKSSNMLNKANFLDIYERDEEILGADLVVQHKLKRFKPGENRTDEFVLDPETKFVGLFAEFFDFKTSSYKLLIPVVSNNIFENGVVIRISENKLILNTN